MRRFVGILSAVLFFCLAAAVAGTPSEAKELTGQATVECTGGKVLTDGDEVTYTKLAAGDSVIISSEEGISSLYIIFDRIYGEWILSDGMTDVVCGQNLFLHEYVDVAGLFGYFPTSLTLIFSDHDCWLSELYIFGGSEVPDWVQRWEPPCEEADLMLASTHIDDEQLFFAGILPFYAGERNLAVQVVYFTNPFTYHDRPHEQLNGLWTVGVRNYPVSGEFIDAYSETAKDAYAHQVRYGFEHEDMVRFQVEMIRRFRPHVIVGHDIKGEYSHGQHIINCETLMEALELAADPSYDQDSATEYGVWDTPKTYIHLWEENPIIMDWDVPLEAFGGKTAFQVSQEGFLCHNSQQWTWFRSWMFGNNGEITKASEIKKYSPCFYGLFRTKVGLDSIGSDMFENIPQSYAEIKAEEIRRQEALAEAEREKQVHSSQEEQSASLEEQAVYSEDQVVIPEESRPGNSTEGESDVSKPDYNTVIFMLSVTVVIMTLIVLLFTLKGRRRKS